VGFKEDSALEISDLIAVFNLKGLACKKCDRGFDGRGESTLCFQKELEVAM